MDFFKPRRLIETLKIRLLYRSAFPKCERKPFSIITNMAKRGKTDLWYFEKDGKFVGMCDTINGSDTILIDYLAVAKNKRGIGIGTEMLSDMLSYYKDYGVFLEIEEVDPTHTNNDERVRRREFYLRSGFKPMNTFVKLFGVNMELLGANCQLSFDEYHDFYLTNYSKFAYDNIENLTRP